RRARRRVTWRVRGPTRRVRDRRRRPRAAWRPRRPEANPGERRAAPLTALLGLLRIVIFAPEEMLLVAGSPAVRRAALDGLAGQRSAAYLRDLATYARALQQRNSLLRAIREEQAGRDELRFWDGTFLEAGAAIV